MITQLSVFLQNDRGRLAHLTRRLADADINLMDLFVADTSDFGIVRIFCDTPKKACEILRDAQYRASLTEVLAVRVPHQAGGLAKLLEFMDAHDINIEYGYCFSIDDSAINVMKVEDEGVEEKLIAAGFELVQPSEIYALD